MVVEFTLTVGRGFTVTTWLAVPEQPLASRMVTVYVPEVLTVIDGVVSAVDQRYAEPLALALKVTVSPMQKVVGPLATIAAMVTGVVFSRMSSRLTLDVEVEPFPEAAKCHRNTTCDW